MLVVILGLLASLCLVNGKVTGNTVTERTGDIVLSDDLQPHVSFSWDISGSALFDVQFFDILGRLFGTPRTNLNWDVKMNVDLFDRPSGLSFFSIEGIEGRQLREGDYQILGKDKMMALNPSFEPRNPFTVLATAFTGVGPKLNGITNRRWARHDTSDPAYLTGNFFDAISELRAERVVSGSKSAASASLVSSSKPHKGSYSYHWEHATKTFVGSLEEYSFKESDFAALFVQLSELINKRVVYEAPNVLIYYNDADPTVYDLSDEDDEALIVEILFVLKAKATKCNFFSFHFESPHSIKQKYGPQSQEFNTAILLIDAVVSAFVKSNPSNAHSVFYFPTTYTPKDVLSSLENIVKNYLFVPTGMLPVTAFRSFLPHIYLSSSTSTQNICSQIREVILQSGLVLEVTCPEPSQKRYIFDLGNSSAPSPAPSSSVSPAPSSVPPSGGGTVNMTDVTMMHIILWTCVVLILGLVGSCLQLAYLDGSNEPSFKPRSYGAGRRGQTQKVQ
eukprot:TRINITY_DN1744_c0_g1_i1.p1 TRINITY_DN1744_c0_g1~~TRINITY_DN1744_c0_g1_i1.p1  ORF type:complete len:505 (-),score=41.88 TRINITY_DN1744_c0_g1_i1:49-1563(-)